MTCPCKDYRPPAQHHMRRLVAYRSHRCTECRDTIWPGEVYFRHDVAYVTETEHPVSGVRTTKRNTVIMVLCDCCQEAAQLLQGMGYLWNPGELSRAWAKAWGKDTER